MIGASDVADDSLSGNDVVLISRGTCSFSLKVQNANTAGAGGVIVYNNRSGDPIGMARDPAYPEDWLPAVMVSQADGAAILLVVKVPDTITMVSVSIPKIVQTDANRLADFSSRGPVPFTYEIKPDVVAPGVNILSSTIQFTPFYVTGEGWELFNGTSMASPHVAGAVAVLLGEDAHPDWTPAQVKSALATTANVSPSDEYDLPDEDVWHQGGGLIDLVAANAAETFFYPTNASFGRFKGNARANGAIDIAVSGNTSCTAATPSGDYVTASYDAGTLTVSFDGGRNASSGFYDGYVDITCGGTDYHIPWGAVVER